VRGLRWQLDELEEEPVYQVLEEEDYRNLVKKRQEEDDFVVDDGPWSFFACCR
jgi:phage-related baseplate assembly protein